MVVTVEIVRHMLEINDSNYREFPAIANSDLSWMYEQLEKDKEKLLDLRSAYANGTLIDCMITENHRVDHFKRRVLGEEYRYTKAEWDNARKMKAASDKDMHFQQFIKDCHFQHIGYNPEFPIYCNGELLRDQLGNPVTIPVKCKFDLKHKTADFAADIKSTVATTQKQCIKAAKYFKYPRSRAWYMDIEGHNNDMLIFISKVNYKIFYVPIKRGDELYNQGRKEYQDLLYNWFQMFGNGKN